MPLPSVASYHSSALQGAAAYRARQSQPQRPEIAENPTTQTYQRNFTIFPVQLDEAPQSEPYPFTSFSTDTMQATFMGQEDLSHRIQNIWVETAAYYKQKDGPQHEFIIFSVKDRGNLCNVIALDRNVPAPRKRLIGWRPWARVKQGGTPAQDQFHVSYRNDPVTLINHCASSLSVNTCELVEQLIFPKGVLTLDILVVLASTTTKARPQYTLNKYHCYWFASSVWDCIMELFQGSNIQHRVHTGTRRRFLGVPVPQTQSQLKDILHQYHEDKRTFEAKLKQNQMSYNEKINDENRAENAILEEKVQDLQKRIEAMEAIGRITTCDTSEK